MSYEGKMRDEYKMPSNEEIESALLISLFNHNGTIREFALGEEIVALPALTCPPSGFANVSAETKQLTMNGMTVRKSLIQ